MFDKTSRTRRTALLGAAVMMLAGCQTVDKSAGISVLTNNDWVMIGYFPQAGVGELNEVQLYSYTLHLAADGSASIKLACNKGSGKWAATSSSTAKGTIKFSAIAVTAALCPNDAVGERLAAPNMCGTA